MARTGKSKSIRGKKLEKSQRTQDLHQTTVVYGKEYLEGSKYINVKEEEEFFWHTSKK